MPPYGYCCQFLLGCLDALRVILGVQDGSDLEPCLCCRGSDELEDLLVAVEWLPFPVAADVVEEEVLDRVPLRRTWRIVANGNGDGISVAEPLETSHPDSAARSVATSAIGKDEEMLRAGVTPPPFHPPPGREAIGRELCCASRCSDDDEASIGHWVVETVGDRNALRQGPKVVVEGLLGLLPPGDPTIPEIPDQLPLLRINADDWVASQRELLP